MKCALPVLSVVAVLAAPAFAGNPAEAIGAGRQAIQNKDYNRAVETLQDAVPAAAMLDEPERTQALAALHFYTALAFNAMKNDEKTREALEQFFEFSPQTNKIDPAKYDGRFVRHFNEVRKIFEGSTGSSFETAYPGYRTFSDATPRERPLEQWDEGPEMLLLGTAAERQEYRLLRDDAARRNFIDDFWRRRDRSPGDEANEFRDDFLRRVAFADHMFVTEKIRGSLTDRGRVFVLLGAPKVVRQTNLTVADAATIVNKRGPVAPAQSAGGPLAAQASSWKAMQASELTMANPGGPPVVRGKMERWIYGRNQLPAGFPDDQVTFKFVTEEGYGENVLQRDHLVVKALHDAGHRVQ
ncbi:MAG TPA: GWxTD domain-containing protein [Thermoanaerobaculia bacterium]|nr:GWxTD domain-containing protein [Thermoanaerobaculia bacterium]